MGKPGGSIGGNPPRPRPTNRGGAGPPRPNPMPGGVALNAFRGAPAVWPPRPLGNVPPRPPRPPRAPAGPKTFVWGGGRGDRPPLTLPPAHPPRGPPPGAFGQPAPRPPRTTGRAAAAIGDGVTDDGTGEVSTGGGEGPAGAPTAAGVGTEIVGLGPLAATTTAAAATSAAFSSSSSSSVSSPPPPPSPPPALAAVEAPSAIGSTADSPATAPLSSPSAAATPSSPVATAASACAAVAAASRSCSIRDTRRPAVCRANSSSFGCRVTNCPDLSCRPVPELGTGTERSMDWGIPVGRRTRTLSNVGSPLVGH